MFCRDFEKTAGDLAAGRLLEAGKRERAIRHASECSACAMRLNAERTLEAGLRALSEGAEDGEAPPHLKTALRAVFDRQVKAAPVLTYAPARSRNSARRWMVAAALILLAVAVALLSRSTNSKKDIDRSDGGNTAQREPSRQPVIEPDNQKQKIERYVAKKTPIERRTHRRSAPPDDMASNNEAVTDYIPLTYLADATAVESGTVLRVELPPSALVTMGLPAPVERTDSRVKADVVVGDDGVPRAVRFVGQGPVRR
jgi:hypothetical protein